MLLGRFLEREILTLSLNSIKSGYDFGISFVAGNEIYVRKKKTKLSVFQNEDKKKAKKSRKAERNRSKSAVNRN